MPTIAARSQSCWQIFGTEPVVDPPRRSHRAARRRAVSRAPFESSKSCRRRARGDGRLRIDRRFDAHERLHRRQRAPSARISAICCARSASTSSYAPRALDDVAPYDADVAIVATKSYDTDGAIETLRKAIAHPREMRLRLAAKRRRQRREPCRGLRRRQRRRGGADDAGRSRSRRQCVGAPRRAVSRSRRWAPTPITGWRRRLRAPG